MLVTVYGWELTKLNEFSDIMMKYTKSIHDTRNSQDSKKNSSVSISEIGNLQKEILDELEEFKSCGFVRVYDILRLVVSNTNGHFPLCNYWSVCALTGLPTQKQLIISQGDKQICIDVRFAPLVYALWLSTHVREVETARLNKLYPRNCQNSMNEKKDLDGIKKLLPDCVVKKYYLAFINTITFLKAKKDQINRSILE